MQLHRFDLLYVSGSILPLNSRFPGFRFYHLHPFFLLHGEHRSFPRHYFCKLSPYGLKKIFDLLGGPVQRIKQLHQTYQNIARIMHKRDSAEG